MIKYDLQTIYLNMIWELQPTNNINPNIIKNCMNPNSINDADLSFELHPSTLTYAIYLKIICKPYDQI